MINLSIIIISKNAGKTIRKCLESVKWANEIIVLDSGSDDDTVAICKEFTDKIFVTNWPGYGIQKNRALEKASGDWVLSIDADEELSGVLQQEIKNRLTESEYDAYIIPRHLVFNNKMLRHAKGLDSVLRLFRRNKGQFTNVPVHEKLEVTGKIAKLKEPMFHHSFPNVKVLLTKLNEYSSISAEMKQKRGDKGGIFRALTSSLWIFIRLYILEKGFLDGREGFVLAVSFAEGAYYRYVKLMFADQ